MRKKASSTKLSHGVLLLAVALLGGCAKSADNELIDGAAAGDLPKVQAALASKADLNAKSDSDVTALAVASGNCRLAVVRTLIAAGADVNAKSSDGVTALILASAGCPEAVDVLIGAGADANANSAQLGTPLHMAAMRGQVRTAQALLDAGANVNAQYAGYTPLKVAQPTEHPLTSIEKLNEVAELLRQHGGHE
ncbi:MAG TPA: ankyrin repeat domain-containing protein [Caulobacteraceae bacterium]|nr:ankyrin repeat domain-containing protein [Caulobacteraceae bacterium]